MTVRQLQELLQVDRTTIYRMLKDGRLQGMKVGGRWRFERSAIEAWLRTSDQSFSANSPMEGEGTDTALPMHCIQIIQDVFAEIIGVGSVTTALDGEPLTEISNAQPFCRAILAEDQGRRACMESWRRLAQSPGDPGTFYRCHAGLEYSCAHIRVHDRDTNVIIAGQFYSQPPDQAEQKERAAELERKLGFQPGNLQSLTAEIPVLEERVSEKIGFWLRRVASSFCDIGQERLDLISRLRQIAEITAVD
ncbi:MAG: PocR ligand-binding domain-containing protein [Anaerolineales bacterium]|jgi:excisionase family DNA binding protein